MNLYIEIENGTTKNHPALEENLIDAFGEIPTHWEYFVRVERPTLSIYEVMTSDQAIYKKVNNVWTDVWHKRDMTAQEKTVKQQAVISAFNQREQLENWSTWTFDEATCKMVSPVPFPAPIENVIIMWCGADNNWKEAPAYPVDNKEYKFDFIAWQWVAI